MRSRATAILAALAVLGWAAPAAASTVSMIWVGSSATDATGVGTSDIWNVAPSSTAVLDIRVTLSAVAAVSGVEALGVSFLYDPSVMTAIDKTVCPAGPDNPFGPGACGSTANGVPPAGVEDLLSPLLDTLNQPAGGGQIVDTVVASTPGGHGQLNGTSFVLARITFHVVGPAQTGSLFFSDFDGQVDLGGNFTPTIPGTGATLHTEPIPEPATALLLALGLGALGLAARRRPGGRA